MLLARSPKKTISRGKILSSNSSSPLHISTSPRGAVLPSGSLPPTVKAAASERTIVLRSGREGGKYHHGQYLRSRCGPRGGSAPLGLGSGARVANKTTRTVTSPLDRLAPVTEASVRTGA